MGLYPDQVERLGKLGRVVFYNDKPETAEEWLKRCKGADIICTRKLGLKDKIYELSDVFVSLPFVGVSFLNKERLDQKKITIAYCPGCNKAAVSEWIIGMMINLLRKLPQNTNIKQLPNNSDPERTIGLMGKTVAILGAGNIGMRVGKLCEALDMQVIFFKRGDNLLKSVKSADIIVNCLSYSPATENLLDSSFFNSLKNGSYYLSIANDKINDIEALFESLNNGILAGLALDVGDIQAGCYNDPLYQKLIAHPKILATPHIAYNTDVTSRISYDTMIDNIEAWLKGKPINLLQRNKGTLPTNNATDYIFKGSSVQAARKAVKPA